MSSLSTVEFIEQNLDEMSDKDIHDILWLNARVELLAEVITEYFDMVEEGTLSYELSMDSSFHLTLHARTDGFALDKDGLVYFLVALENLQKLKIWSAGDETISLTFTISLEGKNEQR